MGRMTSQEIIDKLKAFDMADAKITGIDNEGRALYYTIDDIYYDEQDGIVMQMTAKDTVDDETYNEWCKKHEEEVRNDSAGID